MNRTQTEGKYARLRRELHAACLSPRWNPGMIKRLIEDLSETASLLATASGQAPGVDGGQPSASPVVHVVAAAGGPDSLNPNPSRQPRLKAFTD